MIMDDAAENNPPSRAAGGAAAPVRPNLRSACRDVALDPQLHGALSDAWGTVRRGFAESWRRHGGSIALADACVDLVSSAMKRRSK